MNTSQTSTLSEPAGDGRVSQGTLAYFQTRNRTRLHDIVLSEFEKSGISQATLARRLGKRPEVVSRFLSAPGNWEVDSVSDYLFAISGAELSYGTSHPLSEAVRNNTQPDWVVGLSISSADPTSYTLDASGLSPGANIFPSTSAKFVVVSTASDTDATKRIVAAA